MEFGETFEKTVRRGIKEEYCVEPEDLKFCGANNVLRKNGRKKTHWIAVLFTAKVDPEKVKIGEPRKIDEVRWFPFNKLPKPLHSMLKQHLKMVKEWL